MADLKMNEFTTVTSVSKVVGVDGNGNNRLIATSDVINAGSQLSLPGNDLNNAVKTGVYVANSTTKNSAMNDYGVVEVIVKSPYIIQNFFALNQNKIFSRKSLNSGSSFYDWFQVV